MGVESPEQSINFIDKNNNLLSKISCSIGSDSYTRLYITAYGSNNNPDGFFLRRTTSGTSIVPTTSSAVWLGNIIAPFYNVQTKKINTLEPSSLSLPSGNANLCLVVMLMMLSILVLILLLWMEHLTVIQFRLMVGLV